MANPGYVRSTDGVNADTGATWALANADLTGAIADAAAGDTIYVSQSHAQTQATALTLTFPGTNASPNKIIFGDDAAEPPTALATTGSVSTTGTSSLTLNGSFSWHGGTVSCGSSTTSSTLSIAAADTNFQWYYSTAFVIGTTSTSARIAIGVTTSTVETRAELVNCSFKFAATAQGLNLARSVRIYGGSIDGAGSKPSALIATAPAGSLDCVLERFDASNCATTFNWVASGAAASGLLRLVNCRVPASWTGGLIAGAINNPSFRVDALNLSNGAQSYGRWIEDYYGSILTELTVIRTGGASDGTTGVSWKMAANNTVYPFGALESPPMDLFFSTSDVSVSKTITVEILTDSATALLDTDVCLELVAQDSAGSPLGSHQTTQPTNPITAGSTLTSSSATWTTTGLTNPQARKLSLTVTPAYEGPAMAVVRVYKAQTIYVDPQPVKT